MEIFTGVLGHTKFRFTELLTKVASGNGKLEVVFPSFVRVALTS